MTTLSMDQVSLLSNLKKTRLINISSSVEELIDPLVKYLPWELSESTIKNIEWKSNMSVKDSYGLYLIKSVLHGNKMIWCYVDKGGSKWVLGEYPYTSVEQVRGLMLSLHTFIEKFPYSAEDLKKHLKNFKKNFPCKLSRTWKSFKVFGLTIFKYPVSSHIEQSYTKLYYNINF